LVALANLSFTSSAGSDQLDVFLGFLSFTALAVSVVFALRSQLWFASFLLYSFAVMAVTPEQPALMVIIIVSGVVVVFAAKAARDRFRKADEENEGMD
jgi:uncharacterized membrane protein